MPTPDHQPMERFFRGEALYGDDFTPQQIAEWYADEAEGYAALGAANFTRYKYAYHGWNNWHGFRHLHGHFAEVLGVGSAYGDEFLPIIDRVSHITVLDPSDVFKRSEIGGKPATYVKPEPSGVIPAPDATFDLVTCFGTLHHIPNVSFVLSQLARVAKPGATILIREPIVSMGDWRKPRQGLTKRERGIPYEILHRFLRQAGLRVRSSSYCGFPLPRMLSRWAPYNSTFVAALDAVISRALSWNYRYHATTHLRKVRPSSVFIVAQRYGVSIEGRRS